MSGSLYPECGGVRDEETARAVGPCDDRRQAMERDPGDMAALAGRLTAAAEQLLLAVKGMDDLGWSTDSYSRSHLRDVASCLASSATRIAALHRGRDPWNDAAEQAP
ncbi:hypothetical protein [Embleya sp. NBC_00896]|uniref:hypothetical protein n=1 Tax=Embleya sp. NBC_00896 TaxID=2975961 RepID=UPI003862E8C5|nr:hypothetical protein OG928_29505 [Embleya sp. NBC_00896]